MFRNINHLEYQLTCSICLCELNEGDYVKKLKCCHIFHSDCIDPWLLNEKAVCPICRCGIYDLDSWVFF